MEDPWQEVYDILLEAKKSDDPVKSLKGKVGIIGDDRARMWLAGKIVRIENGKTTLDDAIKELKANHPEVVEKQEPQEKEKTSGTPSVYFMGHSWGNGITDYGKYDFSENNIELHSKSGKDTVDGMGMDAALSKLKKSGSYDAVAVLIGINDYLSGYETFKSKFQKIIDGAFQHGEEVFIFNIPHYSGADNGKLDKVNAWLKEQEGNYAGLHIIDIASLHKNGSLHPSSYGRFRKAFIQSLKEVYPDVISQKLDYVPRKTAVNDSEKKKLAA